MPTIHQYKQHQFKGQSNGGGGDHHHPQCHQHAGNHQVDNQKRDENREAYLKCGFQLAGHVGREQNANTGPLQGPEAVPMRILLPAYVTSELKTAFQIGFTIFIPFLIIDLVIASVLMALGMMMVPPATIALPFKLMLFVLVDGWQLLVSSLAQSFYS